MDGDPDSKDASQGEGSAGPSAAAHLQAMRLNCFHSFSGGWCPSTVLWDPSLVQWAPGCNVDYMHPCPGQDSDTRLPRDTFLSPESVRGGVQLTLTEQSFVLFYHAFLVYCRRGSAKAAIGARVDHQRQ
jgi:hypothetical protein